MEKRRKAKTGNVSQNEKETPPKTNFVIPATPSIFFCELRREIGGSQSVGPRVENSNEA